MTAVRYGISVQNLNLVITAIDARLIPDQVGDDGDTICGGSKVFRQKRKMIHIRVKPDLQTGVNAPWYFDDLLVLPFRWQDFIK